MLNSQIPDNAEAVVPHATNPITGCGLYIGGDGDVTLRPEAAIADVVFVGLRAGSILPVRFTHIRAAGTTATNLVRLF